MTKEIPEIYQIADRVNAYRNNLKRLKRNPNNGTAKLGNKNYDTIKRDLIAVDTVRAYNQFKHILSILNQLQMDVDATVEYAKRPFVDDQTNIPTLVIKTKSNVTNGDKLVVFPTEGLFSDGKNNNAILYAGYYQNPQNLMVTSKTEYTDVDLLKMSRKYHDRLVEEGGVGKDDKQSHAESIVLGIALYLDEKKKELENIPCSSVDRVKLGNSGTRRNHK